MAFPKDKMKGPSGFIKPVGKKPFPKKQVVNQNNPDPQTILATKRK